MLLGPKVETPQGRGVLFHAKETMNQNGSSWFFEEREISLAPSNMLLVRIVIGKVEDRERFLTIIRNTPIMQSQPNWNCVSWIMDVLHRLASDGNAVGTGVLQWQKVRDGAMGYCQKKKDGHRFDGRGSYDLTKAPTYDLIEGKEIVA